MSYIQYVSLETHRKCEFFPADVAIRIVNDVLSNLSRRPQWRLPNAGVVKALRSAYLGHIDYDEVFSSENF